MYCVGLDLQYWDKVKDALSEALYCDSGGISIDDIKNALDGQQMQLWCVHDGDMKAVIVTEIVDYPQYRAARFVAVTGDNMQEWLDLLIDTISRWGAEKGAHAIEFAGRLGWKKVLEPKGFTNPLLMMTKFIEV